MSLRPAGTARSLCDIPAGAVILIVVSALGGASPHALAALAAAHSAPLAGRYCARTLATLAAAAHSRRRAR